MRSDLLELSALEQGAAVAAGEIRSRDLVDATLARIDEVGASVGAFITVSADLARSAADAMDREPATHGAHRPLAGVPTSVKDLVGTAGVRTTYGSAALSDLVPAADAHVVTRMRDAGLISVGKTNTAELGLTAYTRTTVGGSARSPWDLRMTAGGSSGGAAAAVAAGIVAVAHGNDGGGSLRIPASVCGVVGFKPSRGRVSNGPLSDDPTQLLCQGALARTVPDAAALMDAMTGEFSTDPAWAPPLQGSFLDATRRTPPRLRVAAWVDTPFASAVDPEVRAAYTDTIGLLTTLGHDVTEIPCPFPEDGLDAFVTTWAVRSLRVPLPPEADAHLLPITRWWRARGRRIDAEQFLSALTTLNASARRALAVLDDYDAVLTPTLALLPQQEEFFTDVGPEEQLARTHAWSPYAASFSVTGQPSVSLPLQWTEAGLPIGMMLTGRPAQDADLFTLAAQLEDARPWAHLRPPTHRTTQERHS